jgi:hypothetical protein
MRYMLLMYSRETAEGPSAEEVEYLVRTHSAIVADARRKGVLLAVEGLKPTATATTVRTQDGKAIVLDGPFAETKEQLAGYYILECRNLDEAVEWAERIPTSCKGGSGCIEIRPVADLPQPVELSQPANLTQAAANLT